MITAKILAYGEVLWDLLRSGRQLGGAPLNFAYRAACLGEQVAVASRVGTDDLGGDAVRRLAALGLDDRLIQRDAEHPTGTVEVALDDAGAPDFTIADDVAWDYVAATDDLLAAAGEAECVCFGTLAQRAPVSRDTCRRVLDAAADAVKLLDVNLRRQGHTERTVRGSLDRADVVKLNDDELAELAARFELPGAGMPDWARAMNDAFDLDMTVVTLGDRGGLTVPRDGRCTYVPGYVVDVADTVGAGDAFTAGFVHKYLAGAAPGECCRYANAVGALVATRPGGTCQVGAAEVAAFLDEPRRRIADRTLAEFT